MGKFQSLNWLCHHVRVLSDHATTGARSPQSINWERIGEYLEERHARPRFISFLRHLLLGVLRSIGEWTRPGRTVCIFLGKKHSAETQNSPQYSGLFRSSTGITSYLFLRPTLQLRWVAPLTWEEHMHRDRGIACKAQKVWTVVTTVTYKDFEQDGTWLICWCF